MPSTPRKPSQSSPISRRNAKGEEFVLESEAAEGIESDSRSERVLATDRRGNSLTLLEEFSERRKTKDRRSMWLSFACAATSVTFAVLTYFKTH